MNNIETMKNLTEGTFVKITGMEVKNDNDIFVVDCDYRIEGKYAVCHDERCLKKVKINGEPSSVKYNIVFLNERTFKKNPNIKVEIVTDLKAAKKEVNNWLKGITEEEIIVTYEKAQDQTIKEKSIIRFVKGLTFGTFGDKHISKDSIFIVAGCNKTLYIQRLGKQGQELSLLNSSNSFNFSEKLYAIAVNEGYIEVVEKIETKKGDINKTIEENEEETMEETAITAQPETLTSTEEVKEENNSNLTAEALNIGEFTITEDIDTRDNSKIWIVKLNDRVDKEEFNRINTIIKSIGGYYSRFKNGFLFKNNPSDKLGLKENTITEQPEQQTNYTYPEIDINDIESYKVSAEISKRENNNAMFRNNEVDHTKELQKTLQSANDDVIELINMTGCTPYIEYKLKTYLQSFKKKYSEAYISVITHKANNVSWMVSGRGGLNVNRYNKKQEQLTNKMKYQYQLIEEFSSKMKQYKNKIKKEQDEKLKADITENINSVKELPKFKKVKVKIDAGAVNNIFKNGSLEVTANELENYFIIKNWGCWRVYNSKGIEIYQTNTTGTLKEAQQWLVYHLSKVA